MTPRPHQHGGAGVGGSLDLVSVTWMDLDARVWRVELDADRLTLQPDGDPSGRIVLPADRWRHDVYASEHGNDCLVRIETFDRCVRFLLDAEAAAPLLRRLAPPEPEAPVRQRVEPSAPRAGPLLWPKVSPLAVWALIGSSLAFVPFLGLIPAVATIILLALHRARVRRAAALRHSRVICALATVICLCGLGVAALALSCLRLPGSELAPPPLPADPEGRNWGVIAAGILVVFLSLSFHEAAHAITALWMGDDYARSLGRVTLNPIAHIDPFGTVLLPILLAVSGAPIFGYARPVPVHVESLPNRRRAHILIALAGPGSNLLLAAASLMLMLGIACAVRLLAPGAEIQYLGLRSATDLFAAAEASGFLLAPAVGPACTVLKLSFIINTFLAMFNLIPIPPLDGSWVLEHLFPHRLGNFFAVIRPYGFILFLVALYAGLFEYLMLPVFAVLVPGLTMVSAVTGF